VPLVRAWRPVPDVAVVGAVAVVVVVEVAVEDVPEFSVRAEIVVVCTVLSAFPPTAAAVASGSGATCAVSSAEAFSG
jgi:hypothetical protein